MQRRDWIGGASLSLLGACSFRRALFAWEPRFSIDPVFEKEVPWLSEMNVPPTNLPETSEWPARLLSDRLIASSSKLQEWAEVRKSIQDWWLTFLGLDTTKARPAVHWETLEETRLGDVIRTRIRYETHPGWPVEAYLLRPAASKPEVRSAADSKSTRAAVVFHPTVEHSIDEPAGIDLDGKHSDGPRSLGLHLARRGFVVLCPRNFLWPKNRGIQAKEQAARWNEEQTQLVGSGGQNLAVRGMGKMLYDAWVAVDLLAALPGVDVNHISVLGHSLGAKEAMYAIAFDERVRACAASEGGVGIRFSNWDAPWYLNDDVQQHLGKHEHHELLALAAPKPTLIVAGESADGDRGWPWLIRAQEAYALSGNPLRLGQFNHRQGHPLTEEAGKRMVEWIDCYG